MEKTMLKWLSSLRRLTGPKMDAMDGEMAKGRGTYDRQTQKPVLRCSICNGEQVAGFKDVRTGKFEEITLIRNPGELEVFMKTYGIDEISREY